MKAILVLEDGFTLEGQSFTGRFETGGEVIFTTGMTGYQEVLTDPSYYGQMICMTYPLIGNYGITSEDFESSAIHASALLVKECCKEPSNWQSCMSLPHFLKEYGTPGMEHIDTRALTRHLRVNGAMRGYISTEEFDPQVLLKKVQLLPRMEGQNCVKYVCAKDICAWGGSRPYVVSLNGDGSYAWKGDGIPLIVYDFGIKWNIVRLLCSYGFEPLLVPPTFSVDDVKRSGARAVFLSNGPGDPASLTDVIQTVAGIIASGFPVTGICLGHQIIAHALGGRTVKLRFGHHGCNHPVKELLTGAVEISSQNHGFAVALEEIPDVEVTHINLNDRTVEGLRHKRLPVMSVQYHPEACAGPHDSEYLFERFRDMIEQAMGNVL
ncbi:MAG: glutamine-hydrolyzing carbamoyl-phosphate synthase small subunit [Desulfovibrionaceae bacterium]|nr:glutamine-hydrolyzing carbamoyl-phosphate synthase small subunit [Desulfovibrionaceae bacterium]